MRILIQDKETACFFKGGVTWEMDHETAFDFETIHNAAQFCARHRLEHAQILLQCRKTGQEIILPVPHAAAA